MSVALGSPTRRRPPQAAAPRGLVEQVTTLRTLSLGAGFAMRELNRQRRIRRMRSVVIESAEAALDALTLGGGRYSAVMLTLTYAPGCEWRPEHVASCIQWYRKWSQRLKLKLRYQWVIELTKKGVPHYHVLFWARGKFQVPMADKCGAWPWGMSQTERARGAVGYLVKYASKGGLHEGTLPKGARLFGVGGGDAAEKLRTHRAGLPAWLLENISEDARGRRVARVGWVDSVTGEVHQSPFELFWYREPEWGFVVFQILRRSMCGEISSEGNLGRNQVRDDGERAVEL